MKRRLIVCCDGTWQDLGQSYPTNVVKMAQAIKLLDSNNNHHIHQIIYYDEGLGTKQIESGDSIIDILTKLGGGGLGLGIDHKIQDAYRFLCMNYEPEDEIYLFGFSRGAYTVRCLAGLIYNSGLPHREFLRKIPKAYELYREKQNPDNSPDGKNAVDFRSQYGQRVPIKALCCWDTVASLGIPDLIHGLKLDEKFNERYRFFDDKVNPTIKKAIHAVAIDEIRKVFDVTHMESSIPGQVTQVWFPGAHGCVGGGSEQERGLSDGALLWMMEQVEKLGLVLDETHVENGIKPKYKASFDNKPEFPFNIGGPNIRKVTGFDDLHESVKKRWKDDSNYRPENLMPFKEKLDA
ncbi:DUF2235 domain-containing protein [Crocosphaera sp. XPORK-15E]|uniref:DUF2235 domain-containing protein n=1 Tax=Crocosphaera sp. XPORK-15E TaxID=3110247 RepID=UPI002B1FC46D|nr:DUF2235 domain-containing protein [Crocosphaera sp. XPORK-15E]MEA5535367.1 DUF2235 domain-containing protein [Crocosphaera sp. XPORK-15E]